MNSILTGKAVAAMLNASEDVKALVSETSGETTVYRIYPIVSKTDCAYPFIVYRRSAVDVEYTKDGPIAEEADYEIICVAENYASSVEVADAVRTAMENKAGTYATIQVAGTQLQNASENFANDAFIQSLTFNIRLR